jgi:NAD(P)-dependent dehydrogenase (short-subunit alcohol dehydrogenase family)
MLPYSLSKGALEKLTKGLARELARDNITMNLIAPGWINTYRNSGFFKTQDVVIEAGKKAVPLGRIGEPEDFAGIALLLCSQAGRYITGQSIFVDGGMSA